MDQLTILFVVGIIFALVFGGIALYSDWREKHPSIHSEQPPKKA